ncbi:hypothetical protein HRbin24_00071 [bacterium HR24]|nr:hypothetical protein HRbin24_00071 [bacterium HR24]
MMPAAPGHHGLRYCVMLSGGGSKAMKEVVFLVEEGTARKFIARALGHPIFTEADDLDELRAMVRDAVLCHFDEEDRPAVVRLHFVHDELLAV